MFFYDLYLYSPTLKNKDQETFCLLEQMVCAKNALAIDQDWLLMNIPAVSAYKWKTFVRDRKQLGRDSNEDNAHWVLDEATVSCQCVLVNLLSGCHGDCVQYAGRSLLLLQTAQLCVSEVMWLVMAPPPTALMQETHPVQQMLCWDLLYSLRTDMKYTV